MGIDDVGMRQFPLCAPTMSADRSAAVMQSGENLLKLRAFGAVDVENPAIAYFIETAKAAHQQRMLVDLLAAHSLVQASRERIAAQDADDKRFVGRTECLRWPFHETRKVVHKNGLDLVLGGSLRAAGASEE